MLKIYYICSKRGLRLVEIQFAANTDSSAVQANQATSVDIENVEGDNMVLRFQQSLQEESAMPQPFTTRQFQAGNSQAVRLPAELAYPPKTELVVTRVGEKIIVQPLEKTMGNVPHLFAALRKHAVGGASSTFTRPEFVEARRSRSKQ